MKNQPDIPLIGGLSHGNTIHPDAGTDHVEIEPQDCDNSATDSKSTESYERRRFYGEVFGDGFDCFVLGSDDETEQKELARWSIGQPSAKPRHKTHSDFGDDVILADNAPSS